MCRDLFVGLQPPISGSPSYSDSQLLGVSARNTTSYTDSCCNVSLDVHSLFMRTNL